MAGHVARQRTQHVQCRQQDLFIFTAISVDQRATDHQKPIGVLHSGLDGVGVRDVALVQHLVVAALDRRQKCAAGGDERPQRGAVEDGCQSSVGGDLEFSILHAADLN